MHIVFPIHGLRDSGVALLTVSLVAFATCVAAFGVGQVGVAMSAVIVALVTSGAGMACLNDEGRRQRNGERFRGR